MKKVTSTASVLKAAGGLLPFELSEKNPASGTPVEIIMSSDAPSIPEASCVATILTGPWKVPLRITVRTLPLLSVVSVSRPLRMVTPTGAEPILKVTSSPITGTPPAPRTLKVSSEVS